MEFPDTGERCSIKDCKQLNFLPFVCYHCHDTFCKDHFHITSHKCSSFHDNIVCTKTKSSNYVCSDESCKETSPIEMRCIKCKKHFCLQHRYHGCLEYTNKEKTTKLKKWQIPKKQFAEAKAIVDQEISDSLKKSKNTAMANKVFNFIYIIYNKKKYTYHMFILNTVYSGTAYAYKGFSCWS